MSQPLVRLNDFAMMTPAEGAQLLARVKGAGKPVGLGKAALSGQQPVTPVVALSMARGIHIAILGEPATKKTGQRIVKNKKSGRVKVIPSKRTLSWTGEARAVMQIVMAAYDSPPLTGEVAVDYTFYRAKNVADLGGMEAAMDDAMQGIVIGNDRQIVQRTSRREVDKANPRAIVRVTPL